MATSDRSFWAREVVETDEVIDAIDGVVHRFPRVDEAFNALKWTLARNPMSGVLIPGTTPPLYAYRQLGDATANIPNITVVYEHDESRVIIKSIRFASPHN